jgi:hypothetical protein
MMKRESGVKSWAPLVSHIKLRGKGLIEDQRKILVSSYYLNLIVKLMMMMKRKK